MGKKMYSVCVSQLVKGHTPCLLTKPCSSLLLHMRGYLYRHVRVYPTSTILDNKTGRGCVTSLPEKPAGSSPPVTIVEKYRPMIMISKHPAEVHYLDATDRKSYRGRD